MVLVLVVIAWLYVTLMMAVAVAVAEASAINGSLLGAIITFVLYGLLPVSIIVYIFSTPVRKRMRKAREEQAMRQWQLEQEKPAAQTSQTSNSTVQPDGGRQPPTSP